MRYADHWTLPSVLKDAEDRPIAWGSSASRVTSASRLDSPVRFCHAQVLSVDKWVIRDRERRDQRVVYYQPPGVDQDFVLCLTSPFFLDAAARFGHGRAVLMDATFGMCKHKVRPCAHAGGRTPLSRLASHRALYVINAQAWVLMWG